MIIKIEKIKAPANIFALNQPIKLLASISLFDDEISFTITKLKAPGMIPKSPIKEIKEASSPYKDGSTNNLATIKWYK